MILVGATACSTRTLTIESEPPGATVWLDQKALGTTPVTVEDRYGGVHEIVLLKDRHKPAVVFHDTFNFALDVPPFDAFADLFGAYDQQVVHVTMEENPLFREYEADSKNYLQALHERADILRERTRNQAEEAHPREPVLPKAPERGDPGR